MITCGRTSASISAIRIKEMRLPITFVALVLAAPVCAQLWKPVDDVTSAVGKPTPERVPIFTDPPKSTPETPKKPNTTPVRVMTSEEYQEYRRQNPYQPLPKTYQSSPQPASTTSTYRPSPSVTNRNYSSSRRSGGGGKGCGSRGGPGYRLPNGKCASWND